MNYFHLIPLESLWNHSTLEHFEYIQVNETSEASDDKSEGS